MLILAFWTALSIIQVYFSAFLLWNSVICSNFATLIIMDSLAPHTKRSNNNDGCIVKLIEYMPWPLIGDRNCPPIKKASRPLICGMVQCSYRNNCWGFLFYLNCSNCGKLIGVPYKLSNLQLACRTIHTNMHIYRPILSGSIVNSTKWR